MADYSLVWTSDLAYAVGLIATDGYLSIDKRHLSVTSKDIQLLKTFLLCLNKTNQVTPLSPGSYTRKPVFRVQIGDVKLYAFLKKIGLSPCKSLILGKLTIPNKFFRDFVRGHLDGDGSVITYKDEYLTKFNAKYTYHRLFVYLISASKPHVFWLQQKILKLIDIKGSISYLPSKNKKLHGIYRLKYSTKEAKILLNWIYYNTNLPLLKRKYQIAHPFVHNFSSVLHLCCRI